MVCPTCWRKSIPICHSLPWHVLPPQKLHTHPLDKCNKNAFKTRLDKVMAQRLSASVLGELWHTEGLEAAECWVPAENSSLLCLPLAPPHRLGQGREGAARGPAPLGG